ncbi:MAG: PilN domain-containing protein [Ottowia sp.]|nr:PilN domain-containing protein [Ottowia sp.]
MILINLLPHRELARQRARKMFNIAMGAAALLGLLIAGLVYGWYQAQISEQQSRNNLLTSEIKKLEAEIKEVETLEEEIAALRARQDAVENLQADRNIPVHLLSESVRQLPAGVYLTSIKQQGQSVLYGGAAQSQERVSELLRNLSHGSDWLKRPELIEIVARTIKLSAREVRRVYNFTIRAQIQRASAPAKAASAAGGA